MGGVNYRNNVISGRENEDISTGNNFWAFSFQSFFDGLNVPEISQPKAYIVKQVNSIT